jgi:hypothetical protein
MLVLDTTSKTITAVLAAPPATNQLNYVVAWADNNGTTFTEGASDGTTNSTTTVTMVASPAASTRRVIKSIYIKNTDTAQATVTVGYYNGTNTRVIAEVILNIGDTWTTDATFDRNGQLKYVFGSVNATTQLIGIVPILNGGTGSATLAGASIVTYTGSETLTNKTLTAPVISTISNTGTLTLPTSTDTLVGRATTDTLTNKTLTSPVIGTIVNTGTLTLPTSTDTLVGRATTDTLTNKRIDPRVSSVTTATVVAPDIRSFDVYAFKQLSSDLSINAPSTTSPAPVDGDKLIFRFLDNGTARTLTWDATYTVIGVTLPTTTTASKTTYVGCIYNAYGASGTGRWDVIAVTTQA